MSGVNSDPTKLPGVDPSAYNQHPPSARLGQGYECVPLSTCRLGCESRADLSYLPAVLVTRCAVVSLPQ